MARTFGLSPTSVSQEPGVDPGIAWRGFLDSSGIVNDQLDSRTPVRHKLLDLLGDISLAGYPIIGHLHAERAGHAIHTALADQIARQKTHYQVCTAEELESFPAEAAV
jgi:UDP-3-O-[3-hydroxymyristoyl] N-acetylglucosamine deacetylase